MSWGTGIQDKFIEYNNFIQVPSLNIKHTSTPSIMCRQKKIQNSNFLNCSPRSSAELHLDFLRPKSSLYSLNYFERRFFNNLPNTYMSLTLNSFVKYVIDNELHLIDEDINCPSLFPKTAD